MYEQPQTRHLIVRTNPPILAILPILKILIPTVTLNSFLAACSRALPPVSEKNMLNLAFPAPKFRCSGDFNIPLSSLYIGENQLYITTKTGRLFNLSGREQASTDFEFNKPILKKRLPILNDFEKNSTDFERFIMDFEKILNRAMAMAMRLNSFPQIISLTFLDLLPNEDFVQLA